MEFPEEFKIHPYYPAFQTFCKKNPHILDLILNEINKSKESGLRKVSIKNIIGNLRWNPIIYTETNDDFKINDAFTSLYGILIKYNYPSLGDMFHQRELRSLGGMAPNPYSKPDAEKKAITHPSVTPTVVKKIKKTFWDVVKEFLKL